MAGQARRREASLAFGAAAAGAARAALTAQARQAADQAASELLREAREVARAGLEAQELFPPPIPCLGLRAVRPSMRRQGAAAAWKA
jgi:hypothetical protein